ncbi:ribosome biogenesis GTP-binding protein YihA/YsxC [Govanella unica]|uniref:Probable GTP-binding protein EngB n=1 Tax=Govanella unica TaxID=2975056 RepID=A0A9X3TWE4_9PROT|nr:ribosome biogenesis GTP-binding protein YihA/YsxC [Govania unica]
MGGDENGAQDAAALARSIEHGRWLFAQSCTFMLGVAGLGQLPDTSLPEIAFAGRSNVGKSSLINALTARNTLARTSNTPGRTRELNFFRLGGKDTALRLVDLPGYGYARISRDTVERWTQLLRAYLAGRPNLKRVCVLIDSRHGVKETDHEIMTMLDETAVSYQVVLTKFDKLSASEQAAIHDTVVGQIRRHVAAHPEVIVTSSEDGTGIAELRAKIAAFAPRSV